MPYKFNQKGNKCCLKIKQKTVVALLAGAKWCAVIVQKPIRTRQKRQFWLEWYNVTSTARRMNGRVRRAHHIHHWISIINSACTLHTHISFDSVIYSFKVYVRTQIMDAAVSCLQSFTDESCWAGPHWRAECTHTNSSLVWCTRLDSWAQTLWRHRA